MKGCLFNDKTKLNPLRGEERGINRFKIQKF